MSAGTQNGLAMLYEMQEFASFPKAAQRYIRRSLDVGLKRRDAIKRWSRSPAEADNIRAQQRAYRQLEEIRGLIPDDIAIEPSVALLTPLVTVSAFDLAQLPCFSAYRFLYERLIGAAVRPWLPSAFCAAAALPYLHPEQRRVLLESVGEAVSWPAWSRREPGFIPEWVEKVDTVISA